MPPSSEAIGFLVALLFLLVAFGSIVAAGMLLVIVLFGLFSALMLVGIESVFFDIPTFTPILLSMIGIGVGIDYTLFIITRYRENLRNGDSWEDAIAHAMDAAGRAVIFTGMVVVIELAGLIAIQIPLFTVIVDQPEGLDEATIATLSENLMITDGIISVGPAIPNDEDTVAVMTERLAPDRKQLS